jgi:hypothetical protein
LEYVLLFEGVIFENWKLECVGEDKGTLAIAGGSFLRKDLGLCFWMALAEKNYYVDKEKNWFSCRREVLFPSG